MNDERTPGIFENEPGVRSYVLVCLVGLIAVMVGLVQRNAGLSGFFPLIVGTLALMLRWKYAPLYLIVSVVWVASAANIGLDLFSSVSYVFGWTHGMSGSAVKQPLSNAILCVGVLLYSAGCYRLHGLVLHLFPQDQRHYPSSFGKWRGVRPQPRQRRSARLVSGAEIARLVIIVVGCTTAAFIFWSWLDALGERQQSRAEVWRVTVLVWLFGIGLIIAASVFGYLAQRRMLPDEAALYLQDSVWRETPREQRRVMAWLAWARLRRKNREVHP
jgi:hypothetical protein